MDVTLQLIKLFVCLRERDMMLYDCTCSLRVKPSSVTCVFVVAIQKNRMDAEAGRLSLFFGGSGSGCGFGASSQRARPLYGTVSESWMSVRETVRYRINGIGQV